MDQLSNIQRAKIIEIFIQENHSPTAAQRRIRNELKVRVDRNQITRLYDKFLNRNCFSTDHMKFRKGVAGRKPTVATTVNRHRVAASVLLSPRKSLTRRSLELGMKKTTLRKVINDLQIKPYKIREVQQLNPTDYDEAKFFLNGTVSSTHAYYWASENPHERVQRSMDQRGVMVFCAFTASEILGPYFFEENVDQLMRNFLANFLTTTEQHTKSYRVKRKRIEKNQYLATTHVKTAKQTQMRSTKLKSVKDEFSNGKDMKFERNMTLPYKQESEKQKSTFSLRSMSAVEIHLAAYRAQPTWGNDLLQRGPLRGPVDPNDIREQHILGLPKKYALGFQRLQNFVPFTANDFTRSICTITIFHILVQKWNYIVGTYSTWSSTTAVKKYKELDAAFIAATEIKTLHMSPISVEHDLHSDTCLPLDTSVVYVSSTDITTSQRAREMNDQINHFKETISDYSNKIFQMSAKSRQNEMEIQNISDMNVEVMKTNRRLFIQYTADCYGSNLLSRHCPPSISRDKSLDQI
ncbi:hypothetical protein B566_EDAN014349 [Ephemera danica]|nr:hypothetical protein B566_EDAN014349 [Ephemera danica]